MRNFFFKLLCLTVAVILGFAWLQSDSGILSGSSSLGMDDSTNWLAGNNQDSKAFDVLETINVKMLRVEMPWNKVELTPGAYAWAYQDPSGYMDYDQLFTRLEKRGIQPVVILTGGPVYLNSLYPQQPVSSESLLKDWQGFVSAAVQEYGDRVDYWQIGGVINDPAYWGSLLFPTAGASTQTNADFDLYAKMLKSAYSIIKSASAGDTVILGEMALGGDCSEHPLFYLQNLNQKEVWNDFDVVDIKLPALDSAPESAAIDACGFNPLQGNSMALTDPLKAISEFVNEIGQKSLWVNNLSISNEVLIAKAAERTTLPEVVESDYLTRASGLMLAYGGIDKIFWKYQPQSGQPAVIALQSFSNLSKTLSSNANVETVVDSAEFKTLRFHNNGKLTILTWRVQGGDEAQPEVIPGMEGYQLVAFSSDAESLKTSKGVKMGVDAGGSTALMVSERPVLISGRPSNLKEAFSATLNDNANQVNQEMQARLSAWVQVQKNKAADQLDTWVAKQQASLMDTLRSSFQQWIRQSLGLAKK
jgi:hypothetical protein